MQTRKLLKPSTLAAWEIVSVLISCLIAEWVVLAFIGPNKFALAIPVALALMLMISSHRIYGETLHDIGFRIDNFLAAVKLLIVPTVVVLALIIFVSGFFSGVYLADRPFRWRFLLVPFWALFQQYALQGYLNRRAQIVFGKGWKSVLLVALLFAVVHLPNPLLFALTFRRWGDLGHRLSKTTKSLCPRAFPCGRIDYGSLLVPPQWTNSLRVGFKYFG